MNLDFFIVVLYIFSIALVGVTFRTKAKDVKDFAVSARTYGSLTLTATISATFIGGGFSSGGASKAAISGVGAIFTMLGFSLGMLLMGAFLVPKMQIPVGAASAGEIMERAYGKGARIITGILSMIVCSGILGAQIGAIGYIFNVLFGVNPSVGIIIGCVAVIVYSTIGGMSSLVITDSLQFCVLAVCMPLLLFLAVKTLGGFSTFLSNVPKSHLNAFNNSSPVKLFGTALTLALGEILVPPCIQRLLMGHDLNFTKKATLLSGVISVPFFIITGLIGVAGAVIFKNSPINLNSVIPFMIMKVAPVGVRGIIIAGMLSIVLSSADSFLNSASVGLVIDVITPLMKKPPTKSGGLRLIMLVNAITGIAAVIVAITIPNLLDILIFSYSFWSPVILIPLIAALTGVKKSKKAFYMSIVCSCVCMLFSTLIKSESATILGTAGSLIGFICFK